jgi:hypothetical protein
MAILREDSHSGIELMFDRVDMIIPERVGCLGLIPRIFKQSLGASFSQFCSLLLCVCNSAKYPSLGRIALGFPSSNHSSLLLATSHCTSYLHIEADMRLSSFLPSLAFASSAYAAFDLNRGGAVLKAPAGESFTSVTGTFTVPNLSGNSRLSIWLGIGDTLQQTYVIGGGITYNRTLSSFAAFFPEAAIDTTSQVPVRASDSITVTVSLTSPNTGTVVIENKTQNKRVSQTVAAPATADPSALTAQAADWWVQGYQVVEGELLTTPNFGTVTFTAVSATTSSGKKVDATGAGAYELQGTSGQMYSKTTISGNSIAVRRQT